jgi:predicted TIM-barrel fold metal-dependent hydrolase
MFKATGRLAAFKLAIAYERDLVIHDPTVQEAERAFDRIRECATSQEGVQTATGSEVIREFRPLADYLIHHLLRRADDEDIPVQIHTGYLTEHWGPLAGTKALHLLPVFEKYRGVRFDVFHASWPWTSELCAIAKNYPNVYPNMCWMWAMNPTESERTLAEWLDGVPFNKIFAFGSDTEFPWCSVGYAIQARMGIARVLEEKVRRGFFSGATAKEVASAIMLTNGEQLHGLA